MRMLAHGIDVVEIDRIASMMSEHGERFIERCFTDAEREYGEHAAAGRIERYAVRFAAKESVFKALGTGWRSGISWRDVGVVNLPSGQPQLSLTGRSAEIAAELSIRSWLVSLSHSRTIAVASVIGCA